MVGSELLREKELKIRHKVYEVYILTEDVLRSISTEKAKNHSFYKTLILSPEGVKITLTLGLMGVIWVNSILGVSGQD